MTKQDNLALHVVRSKYSTSKIVIITAFISRKQYKVHDLYIDTGDLVLITKMPNSNSGFFHTINLGVVPGFDPDDNDYDDCEINYD